MGETTQWRSLSVATGIAGLASIVGVFGSQALVQVGGSEPSFDASADTILKFLEARHETLYAAGSFLGLIAVLALGWFLAGVSVVLREVEGRPPWRSAVALLSGIVAVALLMSPGWDLAAFRVDDGIEPQLARYAFDMGNLGFASSWVALAGFLFATGWVFLATPQLPNWLGWPALVAALGFLLGRAFWTTQIWLIPYTLFWLWVVAVSIQLFRDRLVQALATAPGPPGGSS